MNTSWRVHALGSFRHRSQRKYPRSTALITPDTTMYVIVLQLSAWLCHDFAFCLCTPRQQWVIYSASTPIFNRLSTRVISIVLCACAAVQVWAPHFIIFVPCTRASLTCAVGIVRMPTRLQQVRLGCSCSKHSSSAHLGAVITVYQHQLGCRDNRSGTHQSGCMTT